ncbi:ATP-binding protein [Saccharothrix xinjiangensis]|uniref:ATP-binding protein n=1 Tax=Saccharothrix xinjiangensis TaxID=204798 RepID=A0ABV9XSJ1_9PSEU
MNATGLPDDGLDSAQAEVPPPVDVARWVREAADDLPGKTARDFALVAEELIANARRHAEGPHLVRLRREDGALRVEVQDRSPSRLPVLGRPGTSNPGTGLLLVNRLSSHWGFHCHDQHKVVWAEVWAA